MIKILCLIILLSLSALCQGDLLKSNIAVNGQMIPVNTIAEAILLAESNSVIEVNGGIFHEHIVIDKPLVLRGKSNPLIDGDHQGSVITIRAPFVRVEGFEIRNSGDSLDKENSGISIQAPNAIVQSNQIKEVLFGVHLAKAHHALIRYNSISGKNLPVARRGDLLRIWYSDDVIFENNLLYGGRDAVLWYSNNLNIKANQITGGRYGLHFMYCNDAIIKSNILMDCSVGAYLMYSARLHLMNNTIIRNRGPSGYGIGLKDMDDGEIKDNLLVDNRVGIYVDNSPNRLDSYMLFANNILAYHDTGILMLPSVKRCRFTKNAFVENGEQVGLNGQGTLTQNDWTFGKNGNFWSDYTGYDADGDGKGDFAHRENRLFENLMERFPPLRIYQYSPVVAAIEFSAKAFPLVELPPKLEDRVPLIYRPPIPHVPQPPPRKDAASLWWIAMMFGGAFILHRAASAPGKSRVQTK